MKQKTDEEILKGILERDNAIFNYIYENLYNQVKYMIVSNSGSDEEAQDVFQEALIVIYNKLVNKELELYCTFKTYLYSVSRLMWLKQLEKKKYKSEEIYDENMTDLRVDDKNILDQIETNERFRLYQKYFKQLNEDCRKVLELFINKVPLREIAEIMGYSSEKYAKKRKYICKEILINNIQKDPKYKELQK